MAALFVQLSYPFLFVSYCLTLYRLLLSGSLLPVEERSAEEDDVFGVDDLEMQTGLLTVEDE